MDNIPLIKISHNHDNPSPTSPTIPTATSPFENIDNIEMNCLTSESEQIPNAQKEKYNLKQSTTTNASNEDSSDVVKHNPSSAPPTIPSANPSKSVDETFQHPSKMNTTRQFSSCPPQKSTEGTYSLVANNMKLSTL